MRNNPATRRVTVWAVVPALRLTLPCRGITEAHDICVEYVKRGLFAHWTRATISPVTFVHTPTNGC